MASPHKLASPQGVLHLVPREARAILDSSHNAKKGINNLEGSHVLRHVRKKRQLQLPELHVDTIHASIPHLLFYGLPPPPTATGSGEEACGEEAYLYVMRRIYNIMNSYEPYAAGCELQNEPRLVEWLTSWRMYNDVVSALGVNPRLCLFCRGRCCRELRHCSSASGAHQVDVGYFVSAAERAKWGRSRQLWFDLECAIEGFVEAVDRARARDAAGRGLSCQRAFPIRLYSVA